jgi:hypothetical protein
VLDVTAWTDTATVAVSRRAAQPAPHLFRHRLMYQNPLFYARAAGRRPASTPDYRINWRRDEETQ